MPAHKNPHWDDVKAWAEEQLAQARADLETSEEGGEQNRGKINALRMLLELPSRIATEHDRRIQRAPT